MTQENNKICERCQKGFYVQAYRFDVAKYCSKECFNEAWSSKHTFNCKNCGNEHVAYGYTKGRKKYCSRKCMEEYRHTPIEELLMKSVQKQENGCWLWTGPTVKGGYGKFCHRKKYYSTHRVSYELFKGPIEKGKHICHTCDVRNCVNPEHLWSGTAKENIQDMIKKDRAPDLRGLKRSEETKKKISESKKKNPTRYWAGKKRSEETKKKISETKRRQRSQAVNYK